MLGQVILVALGATYLMEFMRHWITIHTRPFTVDLQRVHFSNLCHLSLGTFYTLAGVTGH